LPRKKAKNIFKAMKVAFVGAGNVAWHLAQAFEKAGIVVTEICSKNILNAQELSKQLSQTQAHTHLNFSESKADFLILAVSDDALIQIVKELILPSSMVVAHTSGSVSMSVFEGMESAYGVFYPLQTFSKHKNIQLEQVPFCVEASSEAALFQLKKLAQHISRKVYEVNSEQRKTLHIGAVFACNFVNHLLHISKNILEEKGLDFEILKPLIQETIQKALESPDPKHVQTGPAARKDLKTIQKHLDYLANDPSKQELYRLLTESILRSL